MPAPTLITQLDAATRDRLTWRAMVADGIEEAPLAIMRYEQYKRIAAGLPRDDFKARLLRSFAVAASMARKRLQASEALQHYYAKRVELRSVAESMGVDTMGAPFLAKVEAMRPPTGPQSLLEPSAALVLSPDELRERDEQALRELAARPAPTLDQFAVSRGEPEYAPRERSTAATNQRRDFASLERRYRRAVKFVETEERARTRQLEEVGVATTSVEDRGPAPQVMRGADYQRLSPADKVIHDHVLLAYHGLSIPRASKHPLAHLPLHLRPGLR